MSSIEYRRRLREQEQNQREGRLSTFRTVKAPAVDPDQHDGELATAPVVETPTTPARTPEELRQQAQAQVDHLLTLPDEEYAATLKSLYENDETLYAVVYDELDNIAAAEVAATDTEIGQAQADAEAVEEPAAEEEEPVRAPEEQAVIDQEADDIIATEDYLNDDGGAA